MKKLIVLAYLLMSCDITPAPVPPKVVGAEEIIVDTGAISHTTFVIHDDRRNVTCWLSYAGGIYCMPDVSFAR